MGFSNFTILSVFELDNNDCNFEQNIVFCLFYVSMHEYKILRIINLNIFNSSENDFSVTEFQLICSNDCYWQNFLALI